MYDNDFEAMEIYMALKKAHAQNWPYKDEEDENVVNPNCIVSKNMKKLK